MGSSLRLASCLVQAGYCAGEGGAGGGAGRATSVPWARPPALDAMWRGSGGKYISASCQCDGIDPSKTRKVQEGKVQVLGASLGRSGQGRDSESAQPGGEVAGE